MVKVSVCLVPPTVSIPWRIAESVLVLRATSEQCWKNLTILAHVRLIVNPRRACAKRVTVLAWCVCVCVCVCVKCFEF